MIKHVKMATHATMTAGFYVFILGLFHSFYQKFGPAPEWLVGMLSESPLAFTTQIGWVAIGILQLLVLVFAALSIANLEFFKPGKKDWLGAATATALLSMAVMAMGTGFAGEYDQMFEFMVYMTAFASFYGVTFIMGLEREAE